MHLVASVFVVARASLVDRQAAKVIDIGKGTQLMSAITCRSFVVAAVLFTLAASPGAAQEAPSGSSRVEPVGQSDISTGDDDDAAMVLAEPDFRVLNLPSTLRLPLHGSSFQLTHRFNGNLRRGSFSANAGNLFGLDQGAVVGFEYRFGIARHLHAAVYRTAVDQTLQLYGKYDAVRQSDVTPLSLSALVSVEGADNFQERYSPAVGLVASRTVSDRVAVYGTPLWVHNTAALLNIDRDTYMVGIGGRVRVSDTVYLVAEVAPRVGGYAPEQPAYGFAVEKRAGGHMFQLNFNNGQGTTFGQVARGGFADSLYLGFNLARKFF